MKRNFGLKLLCLVIALALTAVCIPFGAMAATESEIKLGLLSDIHYLAEENMGPDRDLFDQVCRLSNYESNLSDSFMDCVFATLKAEQAAGNLDYVLISGDLTRNGEYTGHVALANRLKQFEAETGIQVLVIDGNHDINNGNAEKFDGTRALPDDPCTPEQFREIYADLGYDLADAFYTPPAGKKAGGLSYAATLGNYRLIALDGGRYSADNTDKGNDEHETAGSFTPELLQWAVEQCEYAKEHGLTPIGINHFNLVPHFDTEESLFEAFVLKEWEKVADTLADAGMNYMISGHVHMHDVADYVSDNGNKITDLCSGSIINYPNNFRMVDLKTASDGSTTLDYYTHDIDDTIPVKIGGVNQPVPFRYQSFAINFGGDNIKNYVMNLVEYQLKYKLGPQIKDAGGLYNYLDKLVDFNKLIANAANNETIGSVGATAIKALLYSVCGQLEKTYIDDPDYTLQALSPIMDKFANMKVSDVKCTKWKDTLGFSSANDYGSFGDLASTILAYHYTNDEDPENDAFLQDTIQRFYNNQNAKGIVNTLFELIFDDLLQKEIFTHVKIDPVTYMTYSEYGDQISGVLGGILSALPLDGLSVDSDLATLTSVIITSGMFGNEEESLSSVAKAVLKDYLTPTLYETIDLEFYRIANAFTRDETPQPQMDYHGTITTSGTYPVTATASNMRLPSNIALTFGTDPGTTANISYYTKYSLTDTDIQIVPYSSNPDFSNGSTVNCKVKKNCDVEVTRYMKSIDIGVFGILKHPMYVNRHTIKITGLEPGKKYSYRVGDASRNWWSNAGVIKTADGSDKLSFIQVSDAMNSKQKQYEDNFATVLETAAKKHNFDFISSSGNLVEDGGDFMHWKLMLNTASDVLMDNALMSASGKAEAKGDYALTDNYLLSGLPDQDATSGVYYSYDYNNAHIAVINSNNLTSSNTLSDDQLSWLQDDISGSDAQWKIVVINQMVLDAGFLDTSDRTALVEQLKQLLPTLGADLLLGGNEKIYIRTNVLDSNGEVKAGDDTDKYKGLGYGSKTNPKGTIYTFNSSAGSYRNTVDQRDTQDNFNGVEQVLAFDSPSYSYIQIDGDSLYFDTYAVKNGKASRVDNVAISKTYNESDEDNNNTPADDGSGNNAVTPSDTDYNNNQGGAIANTNNNFNNLVLRLIIAFTVIDAFAIAFMIQRRRELGQEKS